MFFNIIFGRMHCMYATRGDECDAFCTMYHGLNVDGEPELHNKPYLTMKTKCLSCQPPANVFDMITTLACTRLLSLSHNTHTLRWEKKRNIATFDINSGLLVSLWFELFIKICAINSTILLSSIRQSMHYAIWYIYGCEILATVGKHNTESFHQSSYVISLSISIGTNNTSNANNPSKCIIAMLLHN